MCLDVGLLGHHCLFLHLPLRGLQIHVQQRHLRGQILDLLVLSINLVLKLAQLLVQFVELLLLLRDNVLSLFDGVLVLNILVDDMLVLLSQLFVFLGQILVEQQQLLAVPKQVATHPKGLLEVLLHLLDVGIDLGHLFPRVGIHHGLSPGFEAVLRGILQALYFHLEEVEIREEERGLLIGAIVTRLAAELPLEPVPIDGGHG